MKKRLLILGIRGIPASHGGFESFAERLAQYLVGQGWEVGVYCQVEKSGSLLSGQRPRRRLWNGIELIEIAVPKSNALCSILFDFRSTLHALKDKDALILVLGYNTACFSFLYSLKQRTVLTNMDGLEWQRSKWNWLEKAWLYLNEKSAIRHSKHLIADHPQIKKHYVDRGVPGSKLTVIPYCSDPVTGADAKLLEKYNLKKNGYAVIIARPEPENSILEIVRAFSRKPRNCKLVVLGRYNPKANPYHKQVIAAASNEVLFPGAIYDPAIVQAIRYYTRLYLHGHTVGGTNPSLIEALAAGSPILAHFNHFNYWVAGPDAQYFYDDDHVCTQLDDLLDNEQALQKMRKASVARFRSAFANDQDVIAHERLLLEFLSGDAERATPPRELISTGRNQR